MKSCINNVHIAIFILTIISINTIMHVNSSYLRSEQNFNNNNPNINVGDLTRAVKPYYEQPYNPIIVNKIEETLPKPSDSNSHMTEAKIVGDIEVNKGFREKPVLYSTVIKPRSTSVSHNVFGATGSNIPLNRQQNQAMNNYPNPGLDTNDSFNNQLEASRLAKGQYAVPVHITNKRVNTDPTQLNYDSPSFIEKKQIAGLPLYSPEVNPIAAQFMSMATGDINLLKQGLNSTNSKEGRLESLLFTRKQLKRQANDLIEKQQESIREVSKFHNVTKRLNKVLDRYVENDKKELGLK